MNNDRGGKTDATGSGRRRTGRRSGIMNRPPVVLCILDGWGLREETNGNAVRLAETHAYDQIMAGCPTTTLAAHGTDVGLPEGQIGNSEVGHMNIGAGRTVEMDLPRIDRVCASGDLAGLEGMQRFVAELRASGGTAHVLGLLSEGGVHSRLGHMIEAVTVLADAGLPVAIHAFTDGRDVAPRSAIASLQRLEAAIARTRSEPGTGSGSIIAAARIAIATLSGRYYAMDRDHRWDRIRLAWEAIVRGDGTRHASAAGIIESAYGQGVSDEFIPPAVIGEFAGMRNGDGLLCVNFRADRVRQLLSAIGSPGFEAFGTGRRPQLAVMSGFVPYSDAHDAFMDRIFPKTQVTGTLGSRISEAGLRQVRIAETEKYPHVTYFLNGGEESPFPGEDRVLIPSPRVATYDLAPEMSASGVTTAVVDALESRCQDVIVVNYANPDMVGHTGDLNAAVAACEAVDQGLLRVLKALRQVGGSLLLTADHGNCEMMIDPETGDPHTAHTTNPVPLALVDGPRNACFAAGGRLADLAPTLLHLKGVDPSPGMTGRNLLI